MANVDRGYVSQYSQQVVGISVYVSSTLTDADSDVQASLVNEDTGAALFTRTADHPGVGVYQVSLTPDDTTMVGNYRIVWSFLMSGEQKTMITFFGIGGAEPAYDALPPDLQSIVDRVWIRIADLFDSASGGPFLQSRAQANFNRGRIAQLLSIALGRLNTMAQPHQTYSLDPTLGPAFPTAQWGSLLEQLTWIETVKHLRRSYIEQPDFQNGSISRLDRQDYYRRWGEILNEEQENVQAQLDIFKISFMGLSRPSILVSGGIFGRTFVSNMPFMAARPGLWRNAFY